MKTLAGQQYRTFRKQDVHLVRHPFSPAYARYYDLLGVVAVDHPCSTVVKVLVYGPWEPDGGLPRFALRRKDAPRHETRWQL